LDGAFSTRPLGGDALAAAIGATVALIALLDVLAWAVSRPRGWPEAVAAVPAAVILIAAGAIPASRAAGEAGQLGPVIGFLAAILVLAHLCDEDGLFRACGGWMARTSAGQPRTTPAALLRAADPPFLLFVLGPGIVVTAVTDNGLGTALAPLLPGGTSLPALLVTAALAAALANICNNLPAVLVLLPLAAPSGVGAVLAVLLGVNIGPNLTYTGSLATLLWRRILHHHDSAHSWFRTGRGDGLGSGGSAHRGQGRRPGASRPEEPGQGRPVCRRSRCVPGSAGLARVRS
jgi:Na+/H+ antiporter NhaD/arsenite permease-like protein